MEQKAYYKTLDDYQNNCVISTTMNFNTKYKFIIYLFESSLLNLSS